MRIQIPYNGLELAFQLTTMFVCLCYATLVACSPLLVKFFNVLVSQARGSFAWKRLPCNYYYY